MKDASRRQSDPITHGSADAAAEAPSAVLPESGTGVAPARTPPAALAPLPSYPDFHGIQGWTPAELVHVLHLLSMRTPFDEIAKIFKRPIALIYVVSLHLGISPRQPRHISEANEAKLVQMFQSRGLGACAAQFQPISAKELRTRLVVAGIMASRSIAWHPHEVNYLRHSMKVDRNVTEVAYNLLVSRDIVHAAAERVLQGKRPKPVRCGSHRRQQAAIPTGSATGKDTLLT